MQFNFLRFRFSFFFLQGIDLDVIPTTEIITSSSIDRRALDDSNVPKGFTILGLTKVGDTNFTLRPVNIGSYYRIKVAAYNRAGPGTFSATSHPPVQIPNRNQFIAMKAERKRKEDHDKLIKSLEEDDDEDD